MGFFRQRASTWIGLLALIAGIFLAHPAMCSSVNVPLDNWSYRAIDTLVGFGLIKTAMLGTKPFTRDEMGRLIVEAELGLKALKPRQREVAKGLIKRLRKAYQDEVNVLEGEVGLAPSTFLKPIHELSFDYVHLDGKPTRMLPINRIDATEGTPLVRNNEGIKYRHGENFLVRTTTYGKLWDRFSFYFQPLFALKGQFDDSWDLDAHIHKGYFKFHLGSLEFEFGRDSIYWGQGHQGTLVFTNHAPPLDLMQVSTPHPILLPWIFRHIGLIKGAMFITQLESDRDTPEAKLWGGRLQIKPFPWLEVGVTGGMQFDGEGVPGLNFNDIVPFFRIQSVGKEEGVNKTNQILAFDVRLTFPFLRQTQLYFEYGGEDSGGTFQQGDQGPEYIVGDNAFLVGVYIPRLTDDGRTTFRFEWMQNTFSQDTSPTVWYTHGGFFSSGWTYKDMILGHGAGGDSWEAFWRITRDLTERATLGLDFDYHWRGELLLKRFDFRAQEKHYKGGIDLRYFFDDRLEMWARFAMEKVKNFNLQPGEDRTNAIFRLNLKYHF